MGEEKAMAPHSSTLAWRIPWTEKPGGLQSTGCLPQAELFVRQRAPRSALPSCCLAAQTKRWAEGIRALVFPNLGSGSQSLEEGIRGRQRAPGEALSSFSWCGKGSPSGNSRVCRSKISHEGKLALPSVELWPQEVGPTPFALLLHPRLA